MIVLKWGCKNEDCYSIFLCVHMDLFACPQSHLIGLFFLFISQGNWSKVRAQIEWSKIWICFLLTTITVTPCTHRLPVSLSLFSLSLSVCLSLSIYIYTYLKIDRSRKGFVFLGFIYLFRSDRLNSSVIEYPINKALCHVCSITKAIRWKPTSM